MLSLEGKYCAILSLNMGGGSETDRDFKMHLNTVSDSGEGQYAGCCEHTTEA